MFLSIDLDNNAHHVVKTYFKFSSLWSILFRIYIVKSTIFLFLQTKDMDGFSEGLCSVVAKDNWLLRLMNDWANVFLPIKQELSFNVYYISKGTGENINNTREVTPRFTSSLAFLVFCCSRMNFTIRWSRLYQTGQRYSLVAIAGSRSSLLNLKK